MQQEFSKLSSSCQSKLHCEIHPENELSILHFGERRQRKSRMLCVQCMIESVNQRENICQIAQLHNFTNNPKNTILKIVNIDKDDSQQNISEMLDKIDKKMLKLEEKVKNQLVKIKENIKQMRKWVYQIGEELYKDLKLDDVVKQIQLLKQMDSCQGTNELNNLENKLNIISDNLNNIYQKVKNKQYSNHCVTANTLIDNVQIIKSDIDITFKKCIEYLEKPNLYGASVDIKHFPQIHQQISEGRKIEYQLLYYSARDGLNCQAYWAKCNMQQNLLTIMTSKNGNRFGGYSPCQLNKQLNNYVQDPTMKSFIFQYNYQEIYKLKIKEYAVYCHSDYGPTFGGGHDIHVAADFKSGYSNLGHSYDISIFNIVEKANHILGEKTPQLQECKVYKVMFI